MKGENTNDAQQIAAVLSPSHSEQFIASASTQRDVASTLLLTHTPASLLKDI